MFANRYTALIDACTLVSVWRRDLLLSLAEAEFFRVRWSPDILRETQAALAKLHRQKGHSDNEHRAEKAVAAMCRAFDDAMVEEYEAFLGAANCLPDSRDAHVVAAALKTRAQVIVTENLKHFPASVLERFSMEARSADYFIADTVALDEAAAVAAVRKMRQRKKLPELDADMMLRSFEAHGLVETASILAPHRASL